VAAVDPPRGPRVARWRAWRYTEGVFSDAENPIRPARPPPSRSGGEGGDWLN
jgi:hypothetical protein